MQKDSRRAPHIPTFEVVNRLFHTALLRIPSLNAPEGDLQDSDFQKPIERKPTPDTKAFSADTVANVLDHLDREGLQRALEQVIHKAERNKVFHQGCYGGLRCVAIDAWEPLPPTIAAARIVWCAMSNSGGPGDFPPSHLPTPFHWRDPCLRARLRALISAGPFCRVTLG
jgi:hypothetical protein